MKFHHEEESHSIWELSAADDLDLHPLRHSMEFDVTVIGAGVGGLTAAYLLSQIGKKVAVLDASDISLGQTGRSTAHLTMALCKRYYEIERLHGREGARLAAESQMAAIKRISRIIETEKIDCDFSLLNGYLFESPDVATKKNLQKEMECLRNLDVASASWLDHGPIRSFNMGPCIQFTEQAQLHPTKYARGLAKSVLANGGQIFINTRVCDIKSQGGKAHVMTDGGHVVTSKSAIVATNSPINNVIALHSKQAAYRTYAIALRIKKGIVPDGLYWDTSFPYHYIRKASTDNVGIDYASINNANIDARNESGGGADEILIVGGEDHRTGQDFVGHEPYAKLERWVRDRFPDAGVVIDRWSGQIMEPVDGLAFLGRNPLDAENIYVMTGHSGNGLTNCTLGAMLIRDQILGQNNPWEAIYEPSRVPVKSAVEFAKENANTLWQYSDWLSSGEMDSAEQIESGDGAVLRNGFEKIAVHRDAFGNLVFLSAVCPHLGGIVHWNKVEKSWDCPCHGSRFDGHGRVLEGPAFQDLERRDELAPSHFGLQKLFSDSDGASVGPPILGDLTDPLVSGTLKDGPSST